MFATLTTAEIREQRKALYRPQPDPQIWIAALWPKKGENLGTLLRSCDAFGAGLVVPLGNDATKALSKGNTIGSEKVPLTRVADPARYLRHTQEQGWRMVGVELAHGARPLQSFRGDNRKTLLILGHETRGIPEDAWPYIGEAAEIGQQGIGNCLNVAVAGSIALWWFSLNAGPDKENR